MQEIALFGTVEEEAQFGTVLETALFGGFGVLVDIISYSIIARDIMTNSIISR